MGSTTHNYMYGYWGPYPGGGWGSGQTDVPWGRVSDVGYAMRCMPNLGVDSMQGGHPIGVKVEPNKRPTIHVSDIGYTNQEAQGQ